MDLAFPKTGKVVLRRIDYLRFVSAWTVVTPFSIAGLSLPRRQESRFVLSQFFTV